ncbi:hypothetical protein BJ508DRAFT_31548 [Ascobolus immersus RN42]|uniref:Uncharacterized protein n=1 Tax=Ascobolus immersus RN42 TaxID=1160509 RepID=A0A3N4IFF2_ASCIM|nr:hypothetical protein BJ508DRAFT_31548 [Ascobolus immersus RN42]
MCTQTNNALLFSLHCVCCRSSPPAPALFSAPKSSHSGSLETKKKVKEKSNSKAPSCYREQKCERWVSGSALTGVGSKCQCVIGRWERSGLMSRKESGFISIPR